VAGAGSVADGYTLTVITPRADHQHDAVRQSWLQYRSRLSLPLSLFNTAPGLLLAHPKLGVNSFAEMVALRQVEAGPIELRQPGCRRSSSSDDGR